MPPKPRPADRAALCVALSLLASPASAEPPRGKTVDFTYDASDTRHHDEAYAGRLFVPREARDNPAAPLPLVVFLHGVNRSKDVHRFMGGKHREPDLRAVASDMIARGQAPPFVLAAPSTVLAATVPLGMWPEFDLDRFVERSARTLRGSVTLDLDRVVVVAHSGGGCNPHGGLAQALLGSSLPLRAVVAIDTCMQLAEAEALSRGPDGTDVVVTWQPFTWKRPFAEYRDVFARATPRPSVRFVLDELYPDNNGRAHNAMVELTLRKHLGPLLRPRSPSPDPPRDDG